MHPGGNRQGPDRLWPLPVLRPVRPGEDYYIPWDCVQRFGEDIILIDKPFQRREGEKKKRRW